MYFEFIWVDLNPLINNFENFKISKKTYVAFSANTSHIFR